MDVNEHQGLSNITLKNISKERCKWNIRGYLTLHLKILVRNIDVNEHQGISNITLKNISKERYGCK